MAKDYTVQLLAQTFHNTHRRDLGCNIIITQPHIADIICNIMIRQLCYGAVFRIRDAEDPAVLLLKPHNMPDGISGFPRYRKYDHKTVL